MHVNEEDGATALVMTKKDSDTLAYNDGLMLRFETATPKHIRL